MPNVVASFTAIPAACLAVVLGACGAPPPPASPLPPGPDAPPPPVVMTESHPPAPAAPQTQEDAHKLVILAASCWFGGLWADALGELEPTKTPAIEARCHDLERHVWGADDKTHYEQMRGFEQNAVADVVARVDSTAKSDAVDGPRRAALVNLTTALADALKETTDARRAGDRVKRDLTREPDKLNADEVEAVRPLRAHAKIEALLKLDAGDLSKEANALGILCALDRVEVARGLPRHLKLYAVADSFNLLFGVPPPDVPLDGSKKLVPGTWIRFLTDTARAAGHPVPDKARTPRERDALAWGGMLEGFSDKLKADDDGVAGTTDLNRIVTTVLHRLESEFKAQQAAEATERVRGCKAPKKVPELLDYASTASSRTTRAGTVTSKAPPERVIRTPSASRSTRASTSGRDTRATMASAVGFITKTTRGAPAASSCTVT
jgi:hypothetical protein